MFDGEVEEFLFASEEIVDLFFKGGLGDGIVDVDVFFLADAVGIKLELFICYECFLLTFLCCYNIFALYLA